MSNNLTLALRRFAAKAAHPAVVYWAVPYLMVILTLGTLAQKESGLYAAQEGYFHAFISWIGFVPVPGGALVILLLTINLLAKFLMFSQWSWRKSGIILSHLGVLLLLGGGLWTAQTAQEGFMVIKEGGQSARMQFYDRTELAYLDRDNQLQTSPLQDIAAGDKLPLKDGTAEVLAIYPNAVLVDGKIAPLPLGLEPDSNRAAMLLRVSVQENPLIVAEDMQGLEQDIAKLPAQITLRRAGKTLPFTVALQDFVREFYPASDIVRSYSSAVQVKDGALSWDELISMNKPLRYRGYTLYQSSFDELKDGEVTVLNVVRNSGRLLPYLATAITGAGLLLHLLIIWAQRKREGVA